MNLHTLAKVIEVVRTIEQVERVDTVAAIDSIESQVSNLTEDEKACLNYLRAQPQFLRETL